MLTTGMTAFFILRYSLENTVSGEDQVQHDCIQSFRRDTFREDEHGISHPSLRTSE